MNAAQFKDECNAYLDERRGTYDFRCHRYRAVADRLDAMGLQPTDSIRDLGAGRMEFNKYMRSLGWTGSYDPIDGSIDGTDLDQWYPDNQVAWSVGIEIIEHLDHPEQFIAQTKYGSAKGIVLTTPNPDVVDVLAIDPTHRQADLHHGYFELQGFRTEIRSFFAQEFDTILAWWQR